MTADQRGLSLVETLVGLTVLLLAMGALFPLMIQNARLGKSQRLTAEAQANARTCVAMVVQRLRSAGWDPLNAGIPLVALDPDLSDDVSQIEIFADLDMNGNTDGLLEQTLIRHDGDRVEWKPSNAVGQAFEVVGMNISNDADGDGTPEPMFVPDSTLDPTRITVRVTAVSPVPDPISGQLVRYTVTSEVVLRKTL